MPKAKKKTSKAKTKKSTPKVAKKAAVKKKTAAKKAVKKAVKKTAMKTAPKKAAKKTAKKAAPKKSVKKTAKKAAPKKSAKKTVKKAAPKKSVKKTTKKTAPKKPAKKATRTRGSSSGSDDTLQFQDFTPYKIKKNEDYMNDEQVVHFRNLLHSWKRELMEEVDRTVHHMQDEAANFPDPNDRATQESEFSLELRARDRERKLIKKIDESVINLDSEEYGYCESCGVEIGIRRLEARPTATLCIDCKTLDEIREKQMG